MATNSGLTAKYYWNRPPKLSSSIRPFRSRRYMWSRSKLRDRDLVKASRLRLHQNSKIWDWDRYSSFETETCKFVSKIMVVTNRFL